MKINASLFSIKETQELKTQNIVDYLYSIYELNFDIIDEIFLNSLMNKREFKYSKSSPNYFVLSSNEYVPDINVEVNFLSPFTFDVLMHYKDKEFEKIRYSYYAKYRLFLDAKMLEVKETGFDQSDYRKIKEPEEKMINRSNNDRPIEEKLTKSLLVNEWFNKLLEQGYKIK
ncbi:MAG: hypothetical protein CMD78_03980 [Gammaproteobacteria bacterium]|nr:hypothetical protein [Gammaproteobacteria bacterium]|tara:strand:+ start:1009 stop:1524 length:516 start_codon:yes stop_codon:yes gene_type:complete